MEIIIGLLVVAALAFYLIRKNKEVESELQANESAPYKVSEPPATTPIPLVVESTPGVEAVKVETPVVASKAPAKPRAKKPQASKAPAKPKAVPAKSAKAKAPAIKATPVKKPRVPKAK